MLAAFHVPPDFSVPRTDMPAVQEPCGFGGGFRAELEANCFAMSMIPARFWTEDAQLSWLVFTS